MGIVVGYVANPEGRAALERAGAAAVRLSAPPRGGAQPPPGPGGRRREAELLAAVHDKVRAELAEAGQSVEVREVPDSDDPADDLITAAEESGASLIVIGLRRRTPVGKLILGASAQRILLDAPCPVLAVKPED